MKNINIIIPEVSKKYRFFSSKLVFFNSDWYPVFHNKKFIEPMGYKIRFFTVFNFPGKKISDILIIDSNVRRSLVDKYNATVEEKKDIFVKYIKLMREKTKSLILFDNSDSSTIKFYLLPYVDFYYKKQLFKDESLYEKDLHEERLFSDYYYKKYTKHIKNLSNYENPGIQTNKFLKNKHKIGLSWNILLAISNFQSSFSKALYFLGKKYNLKYGNVDDRKEYIISGNFFKDYERDATSFQRKKMYEFLSNHPLSSRFSVGTLPKRQYRKNIMNAEFVVSPFGWGEICYRDFEAFIAGAALIKPNMSHLVTWPNLYIQDKTYFPISWDFEKWEDEFNIILSNSSKRRKIAENGQIMFKDLWNEKGSKYFSERFVKLLDIK